MPGRPTLVDAGGTPLWYPPASLQEESSLRSTLPENQPSTPRCSAANVLNTATSKGAVQPQRLDSASPVYTYSSFTPINKRSVPVADTLSGDHDPPTYILPTTSETFRQHYGRQIPEITVDMYEVGVHEVDSLDQDERRVYHIGLNRGGSYSGRFEQQSLKPELEQMVSKTLSDNARKKSEELRRRNGAAAGNWIRTALSFGWKLILDQTPDPPVANVNVKCCLPGCPTQAEFEGHYSSEQLQNPGIEQLITPLGSHVPHEIVWDLQDKPRSGAAARDATHPRVPAIPQLDGGSDPIPVPDRGAVKSAPSHQSPRCSGIMASRWANPDNEQHPPPARSRTPDLADITLEDGTPPFPSSSIDSNGDWRHPPRRLQHIALYIEPNATLTEKQRAAVHLWKAASKAQLCWNQHVQNARRVRSDFASNTPVQKTGEAGDCRQFGRDEYDESEIKQYEAVAGFCVKACYGNNLSEVLHWLQDC